MKKIAYYILPLLAGTALITACEDEEYRNPNKVVNSYISEHSELLTSSEYGWRFDYSPNEEKYGVYTFLMDFHENGRVTMQTDRDFFYVGTTSDNPYEPQESDYTIQNSQGPVLTFSTYSLLTKLADPELNVTGYGWEGENDFVIMGHSTSGDTIYLKTLKAQKSCYLVKNTCNWDEYFNGVNKVIEEFTTTSQSNTYFRDIEVQGTQGTEIAVMTEFNMETRMGVVYQIVDEQMKADTCRFRFTVDGINLEEPLLIGAGTEVTHFCYDETSDNFLVNGQTGSTIKFAENGRPKMKFPVSDKVFRGIFEEVLDGVAVEREDMYMLYANPSDSDNEWLALSKKIKDYLYLLIMPGKHIDKPYYIGLYAQLSDEKGQKHTVAVQCQIVYQWSNFTEDEIVFRGFDSEKMYFGGNDTESGDWDWEGKESVLAGEFKESIYDELKAYLGSLFGTGSTKDKKKSYVVVPSPDGLYFNFINKETGGKLVLMKAY